MNPMKKLVAALLTAFMIFSLVSCVEVEDPGDGDKNYTFRYNGHTAAIGDAADPVVAAFGEYRNLEMTGSCAFEEQDRTYTWGGFELLACYIDGTYRVRMIELYDDTVSTPEGIRIGSSRQDVIEIYGNADEESADGLRYFGKDMIFTVFLNQSGTVQRIQYMQKD